MPQPLRYRGYVYDRELLGHGEASGWYWLSVRHYDPATGRFLQPDPSEREGTRSYVYCGDDPLDCADPSGLLSLQDVGNGIYQGARAPRTHCGACLSGSQAQLLPAARISGTVHPGYSGVAEVSSTLKSGS